MKAIIREDDQAVSPVIATILMVAITVVLAAVLYVMVSGLITTPTTPSSGWGINLGKSGDGSNWTLSFTTVPSGALQANTFVTVTTGSGAAISTATNVAMLNIRAGGSGTGYGMYYTPLTTITGPSAPITAGDTLRLSVAVFPSGYTVQITSGTSVVYTHTLA